MSPQGTSNLFFFPDDRTDSELQGGRNACWEAICKLTEGSGLDTIQSVQNLTKIALDRLENSISLRKQAVGMDDRLIAEEQQVQLCAVLNVCKSFQTKLTFRVVYDELARKHGPWQTE
jgi:hypothetical protein